MPVIQKGKNGKCIVFVDEYNPFFLDKFNTLEHPLIAQVGSSFKKDWANNSDITVDFASVNDERKKRYEKMQKLAKEISEKIENGGTQAVTFEESQAEENQRKLKELFESSTSELISFNDAVIPPEINIDDIEEV